jgi:hypothetical protein
MPISKWSECAGKGNQSRLKNQRLDDQKRIIKRDKRYYLTKITLLIQFSSSER